MIDVVGIGAGGLADLPQTQRDLIAEAEVVIGGERHLGMLPADGTQIRATWPSPLRAGLPDLLAAHQGRRIVALASGDPLVAGVGATLIDLCGADHVRIHPALSSVALARARMGWPSDTVTTVRLIGDDLAPLRRELAPGARLIVLSADDRSPRQIAAALAEAGLADSRLTILGNLGGPDESRREAGVTDDLSDVPRLNIVAVSCAGPGSVAATRTPGLPDEAYATTRGQLTKRHIRATVLAMLAPRLGETLWDLGTGSGSVAIEWCRAHRANRAYGVEHNLDRAALARENAARLGAPGVTIIEGESAEVLRDLPDPDAVFIGGGADRHVVEAALARLRPGGRLVAHSVTLQTQALLAELQRIHGGELFEIGIRRAEPIGAFTGWQSSRPVHQWVFEKEQS